MVPSFRAGSIPACAGEPRRYLSSRGHPWVYPRVCGGTAAVPKVPDHGGGLSPRVRGNRGAPGTGGAGRRSIPACAGEPSSGRRRVGKRAVYPRVCGGTGTFGTAAMWSIGLSPRVRGNLAILTCCRGGRRSIPACAGEPFSPRVSPGPSRVYPRVCGGTWSTSQRRRPDSGLSPRVRGNPPHTPRGRPCPGSIPACAGEPHDDECGNGRNRVYPRVCGGTPVAIPEAGHVQGLSPRVRGNPLRLGLIVVVDRSIPACAGEPPASQSDTRPDRVYPRVCGGTQ